MKKALKIIGIVFGILVLAVGVMLFYFNAKGFPTYEVHAKEINVKADSTMLERGAYIVNLNCAFCHKSTSEGNVLSGRLFEENELGKWYAPNITQHPDAGIGKYTDGELDYLLRTGIRRDGSFAGPTMPRFNHLSEEDMHSVIAYLRSDARQVQPSATRQPDSEPSLLGKVLANLVLKPLPYPDEIAPTPAATDKVAYGKYLSTAAIHCYHCHSASFSTVNDLKPELTEGFMGGGNPIINLHNPNEIVPSANITMHPEHGLGNWTEEEFIKAVKYGQGKDGTNSSTAMPRFTSFMDEDLKAIWAYLETIPPLDHAVDKTVASE